jgi:putative SOS response-associated peptidase YedK
MCGRYYRRSDKQAIAEHFRVRNDLTDLVLADWDYNVAPTTMQPVQRLDSSLRWNDFVERVFRFLH